MNLTAHDLDVLNAIAQDPEQTQIWMEAFARTSGIDLADRQEALGVLSHTEASLRAVAFNESATQYLMLSYGKLLAIDGISASFSDRVSHLRDTLGLLSAQQQEPATACTVWGQGERP